MTEMLVVTSRFDESSERKLINSRRSTVTEVLLGGDDFSQMWRTNYPPNPHSWCEGLADRAYSDHSVRHETLNLTDRLAVVPKFGVIVIFDDKTVAVICPLEERVPAVWTENYPSWRLMCRSEDNRSCSSGSQHVNVYTRFIYSNRDGL